ncbi:MAG: hypothetical protein QOG43_2504 [Actinomycetota bacterium]|nr:hypothetical protein [Actinomycetota bacterium]
MTPSARLGAYGIGLVGLDGARRLLGPVAEGGPDIVVERAAGGDLTLASEVIDEAHARCGLSGGGWVEMVSDAAESPTVTIRLHQPRAWDDEAVVHPFLASSAAVVSRWLGRVAFHAGAFVAGGGAVVILGDKGRGKSSTLGWLATQRVPVLTDDLVVVADGQVLVGPRCVDLRPDAAVALGVGENIGLVGARERWRFVLPECPEPAPLAGWVFPGWADEVSLVRIPARERVPRLFEHLALRLPPPDPALFLHLARLPAWEFRRPRGWEHVEPTVARLMEELLASAPSRA